MTTRSSNSPIEGVDIAALATVPGCLGASLVDCETGLMLRSVGGGDLDLDAAATEAAGVLRAARRLSGEIEDLVVNAGALVHLLRPLPEDPNLAVHLILDPARAEPQSARARMDTAIQDRGAPRREPPSHGSRQDAPGRRPL
ncbi:MAG: roadblock/LC7 domain-containing protein [Pseudomonadota bacterium]